MGDHVHFLFPGWRDLLQAFGVVRGTRETCSRARSATRSCPSPRSVPRSAIASCSTRATESAGYGTDGDDEAATFALREEVRTALEQQLLELQAWRASDPDRSPSRRLGRALRAVGGRLTRPVLARGPSRLGMPRDASVGVVPSPSE